MTVSIDLSFPPYAKAASVARHAVRTDLTGTVDATMVERAELLVTELVTNAVRHAGLEPVDEIEVSIRARRGYAWGRVSDRGAGFRPHRSTPRPDAGRGWGIVLVDRIARRWGANASDATRVWFERGNPRTEPQRRDANGP
jgi:anti-sigma regulatory factor (Ser/Thr protein kinase)